MTGTNWSGWWVSTPATAALLEIQGTGRVSQGIQQEGAHVLGRTLDKRQPGRLPQQRGEVAAGHRIVRQLGMAKRGIITTSAVDQSMAFLRSQALQGGQQHLQLVGRSARAPAGEGVARASGDLCPIVVTQRLSLRLTQAGLEVQQELCDARRREQRGGGLVGLVRSHGILFSHAFVLAEISECCLSAPLNVRVNR